MRKKKIGVINSSSSPDRVVSRQLIVDRLRFFWKRFALVSVLMAIAWNPVRVALAQAPLDTRVSEPLPIVSAIEKALATHPLLAAQRNAVNAADAAIEEAKWRYFPTPSLSARRAYADEGDFSYGGDDEVMVLGLEQPLWTGGRLTAGLRSARAGAQQATAQQAGVARDLALRVVNAYGRWYVSWLQAEILEDSLNAHRELLTQVERRAERGASTGTDVTLARGRLLTTEALRDAEMANARSALAELTQLVGEPVKEGALIAANKSRSELVFEERQLLYQAVEHDPEVDSARAAVALAKANLSNQRSALRPDISVHFERVFGDFQVADRGPDNRIVLEARSQLGPGFSNASAVSGARSEIAEAKAQLAAARLAVRQRISADIALARSFDQRITSLEGAVQTAREVADSYRRQFQSGRKSWFDLLNSVRDLQQAELQSAATMAQYWGLSWSLAIRADEISSLSQKITKVEEQDEYTRYSNAFGR